MAAQHSHRFLTLVTDARTRVQECTVQDVHRQMSNGDQFELVDVREESEFAKGHLPGARHLGKGVIERDIEAQIPDSDTPIILYCGGGYRSVLAADALLKMGYRNVVSMDGGWRGWTEANFPVEGVST